jgi:hypothetical protein
MQLLRTLSNIVTCVALHLVLTTHDPAILFSKDINASLRFRITGANTLRFTLCHPRSRQISHAVAALRLLRSCLGMGPEILP